MLHWWLDEAGCRDASINLFVDALWDEMLSLVSVANDHILELKFGILFLQDDMNRGSSKRGHTILVSGPSFQVECHIAGI